MPVLGQAELQVLNGFLAKADGKDKLTALLQYTCLFLSAGEPGNIKKVQASVTAARKIFRIMRPLESITPLLLQPGFSGKQPLPLELLNKLKAVLMAMYFGADHLVWAYQIGLTSDKQLGERAQKVSLWSWALGSVCGMLTETWAIVEVGSTRRGSETDEEWAERQTKANAAINKHLFVFTHGLVQAVVAAGLLQLAPLKPRTVGLLGMVASAMNCYLLLPPSPPRKALAAAAPAQEKLAEKTA